VICIYFDSVCKHNWENNSRPSDLHTRRRKKKYGNGVTQLGKRS
jgi:hypothetical protein